MRNETPNTDEKQQEPRMRHHSSLLSQRDRGGSSIGRSLLIRQSHPSMQKTVVSSFISSNDTYNVGEEASGLASSILTTR